MRSKKCFFSSQQLTRDCRITLPLLFAFFFLLISILLASCATLSFSFLLHYTSFLLSAFPFRSLSFTFVPCVREFLMRLPELLFFFATLLSAKTPWEE